MDAFTPVAVGLILGAGLFVADFIKDRIEWLKRIPILENLR